MYGPAATRASRTTKSRCRQNCGSVTKFTNAGEAIWQKGGYGQGKGNLDREAFYRPSGHLRGSDDERGLHL